ncbi:MAG: riboflavin synthase [Candidatus Melainabacteria bacterium]|nr:riboflavin synthase [Candidatus Melainabacteria bacterium]
MFSGLVEEIGQIRSTRDTTDGRRLIIACRTVLQGLQVGDSICTSGVCLTVVAIAEGCFEVEATFQTLRTTMLGSLKRGDLVNLERALKLSDRLGGHLVTGHVDGLATVESIKEDGFSKLVSFAIDNKLATLVVDKGSVAVDGVSLTVASIGDGDGGEQSQAGKARFAVALIPHTMKVTSLGNLQVGDKVNIETDLIAKYVARLVEPHLGKKVNKAGLSLSFFNEHGYT